MKKAVIINFAYWDKRLKRIHTWGDIVFIDSYKPEQLAESDEVKEVKEKIKSLGVGPEDFTISFTPVTEKVIKEFPI